KGEIRQAGKCIAFDLPTAAGFHLLRALENVIQSYYDSVTKGRARPATGTMGTYIAEIEKNGGEPKLAAILTQKKDHHRNPLMHPQDVLEMNEAIILFGIVQSAMMSIGMEILKASPATALAGSAATAALAP